jgi:CelD/BcsL family acetyltransferase involved in cellulose biosynthesis
MTDAIETHDQIKAISAEWDELASRLQAAPFARPGWLSAWWNAFGSGRLEILALRRDGRLAGVLPVSHRWGVISSPTNWHTAVYGPLGVDEAASSGLLEAASSRRSRRLDFAFLTGEDLELLRGVVAPRAAVSRVIARSPYLTVEQEWDGYWSGLSKNLRGTVRRCRNRLADRGEVTIEVLDGRDDLDRLLEEGLRLEMSGWKGKRGTAIDSQPDTRQFYEELCRWAAPEDILRLAFLRIDGKAAAFNLSFEAHGRHYLLKLGHDVELNSIGPGTVLTAEMVERTFTLGMKSYEFLGDADRYKLRWTDTCHELFRAQVFAGTVSGRLDRLVQTSGRSVAKKVFRRGA